MAPRSLTPVVKHEPLHKLPVGHQVATKLWGIMPRTHIYLSGAHVGSDEILSSLGAGGMGPTPHASCRHDITQRWRAGRMTSGAARANNVTALFLRLKVDV